MKSVELLAAAQAETRLDDFGDCGFVEPLDAVLDSILAEGQLRVAGIEGLRMEIVRHLVNRLRLVRDVCAHPEILEEPLEDPIVIVGLPRSGTTKLQRMIAKIRPCKASHCGRRCIRPRCRSRTRVSRSRAPSSRASPSWPRISPPPTPWRRWRPTRRCSSSSGPSMVRPHGACSTGPRPTSSGCVGGRGSPPMTTSRRCCSTCSGRTTDAAADRGCSRHRCTSATSTCSPKPFPAP